MTKSSTWRRQGSARLPFAEVFADVSAGCWAFMAVLRAARPNPDNGRVEIGQKLICDALGVSRKTLFRFEQEAVEKLHLKVDRYECGEKHLRNSYELPKLTRTKWFSMPIVVLIARGIRALQKRAAAWIAAWTKDDYPADAKVSEVARLAAYKGLRRDEKARQLLRSIRPLLRPLDGSGQLVFDGRLYVYLTDDMAVGVKQVEVDRMEEADLRRMSRSAGVTDPHNDPNPTPTMTHCIKEPHMAAQGDTAEKTAGYEGSGEGGASSDGWWEGLEETEPVVTEDDPEAVGALGLFDSEWIDCTDVRPFEESPEWAVNREATERLRVLQERSSSFAGAQVVGGLITGVGGPRPSDGLRRKKDRPSGASLAERCNRLAAATVSAAAERIANGASAEEFQAGGWS